MANTREQDLELEDSLRRGAVEYLLRGDNNRANQKFEHADQIRKKWATR